VPRAPWTRPLVIGHRGSPGLLPDHTLAGYRKAVEQGADLIEPDLVSTRDGVLVARHENDLTHTTDVATRFPDRRTEKVVDGERITGFFSEDFTLAELQTLRAVQPMASRSHEHDGTLPIATFDAILALRAELEAEFGRPIGVYPEAKHPTYFERIGLPLVSKIRASLGSHALLGPDAPVILQSFETGTFDGFADTGVSRILLVGGPDERPANTPEGPTYGELLADLPGLAQSVDGIGVHKSAVWTAEGPTDLVERAHAAGLFVHVYTFRSEPEQLGPAAEGDPRREVEQFLALGVDGVFADYPDVAFAARERIAPADGG
jgi:glycerophosphoryl diester phosphodiesterase